MPRRTQCFYRKRRKFWQKLKAVKYLLEQIRRKCGCEFAVLEEEIIANDVDVVKDAHGVKK